MPYGIEKRNLGQCSPGTDELQNIWGPFTKLILLRDYAGSVGPCASTKEEQYAFGRWLYWIPTVWMVQNWRKSFWYYFQVRVLRLISGQVYKNQECWWKFLWPVWGGFQWKKLHGSAVLWYICIGELYKHQNELCVTPLLHVRWKLCFIQQSISTLPWPTSEVCRSCKSFSEYSPCIHLCSSGSSWVFITYHELLFSCVELLQAVLFSVRTVSW